MFIVEKFKVNGYANTVAKQMIDYQDSPTLLGMGSYGAVYGSKKHNHVYKLGDVCGNEGYLGYVETLRKQKKHNPFTPKIYGVRFIKGAVDDSHVFVVAMERLTSLPHGLHDVCDFFEEELMCNNKSTYANIEKSLGIKNVKPAALIEAFKILANAYQTASRKSRNCTDWDLHSGNFMTRGKQIVCIDPLA